MDDYAVLGQMQSQPDIRSIPVIILSANDEQKIAEKCVQFGVVVYLSKSIEYDKLESMIASIFPS